MKDARKEAAQKYRDEAEAAEAERIFNDLVEDIDDILDPIEDFSDGTDPQ